MKTNLKKSLLFSLLLSLNLFANEEIVIIQKDSLELKTKNTVLSVGGRVQLDTEYAWPKGIHSAKGIVLGESVGESGHLNFTAKNSRLWVKTRTHSELGVVRALIETDFKGVEGTQTNTNSHGIRLRHAFVELQNWGAGQTNSAFNADTTLDILLTAINDTLVRQPLIRYQYDTTLFNYTISFEQPESTLIDSSGVIITPQDDVVPDIINRFIYYPKWGQLALSVMGRYINQDHAVLGDGITQLNSRDSAFGYGANLSGKIKVFNLDDIRFASHYGKGVGRYLAYNAYAAGSISDEGKITLQPSFGGDIGYRHFWNNKLRTTIAYSYAATKNNLDDIKLNLNKVNKSVHSSQINLIWTPIKNSLLGIEYAYAKRKVESGEDGEIKMVNIMIRYDF